MRFQIPRLNVHIYPSPLQYESRILRITKTLIERAIVDQIMVLGIAENGLAIHENIDEARLVHRIKLKCGRGGFLRSALRFFELHLRAILALRKEKIGMVNCHSLSVLPLCVVLKWLHRAKLIYEPHELETETATCTGFRKPISKWVERLLIGHAERVIVVSEFIASHYRQDYALPSVFVVLNAPELESANDDSSNNLLHQQFNIPKSHLIFMYQGLLDEARGLNVLLSAFQLVSQDRHFVLMGFGPMEDEVRRIAVETPNIHFLPAVKTSEVIRYTRGADVGFVPLTDDCLNHQGALPNKLFHYLHVGLPIIVSNLEEMGGIVDRYQCGWRMANDIVAIARCIDSVDEIAIENFRRGAIRARQDLHWGRETDKFDKIYEGLAAQHENCNRAWGSTSIY